MRFLNEIHEERFSELMKRGNISERDTERAIAMYVLAGNDALYSKASRIYDFEENSFDFDLEENDEGEQEIVWKVGMSSSEEKLALLAFSLYSGRDKVGVVQLFRVLDNNNTRLALNALAHTYLWLEN